MATRKDFSVQNHYFKNRKFQEFYDSQNVQRANFNRMRKIVFAFIAVVAVIVIYSVVHMTTATASVMSCTVVGKTALNDIPMLYTTCGTFSTLSYGDWSRVITGNTYTMEIVDGTMGQPGTIRSISK